MREMLLGLHSLMTQDAGAQQVSGTRYRCGYFHPVQQRLPWDRDRSELICTHQKGGVGNKLPSGPHTKGL